MRLIRAIAAFFRWIAGWFRPERVLIEAHRGLFRQIARQETRAIVNRTFPRLPRRTRRRMAGKLVRARTDELCQQAGLPAINVAGLPKK